MERISWANRIKAVVVNGKNKTTSITRLPATPGKYDEERAFETDRFLASGEDVRGGLSVAMKQRAR